MTVFMVENWPSFCTYMNTLNIVILEIQSQVVFNSRQAMWVLVEASFLSRFMKKRVQKMTKLPLKRKKEKKEHSLQPDGKICHCEGSE